MSKGRGTSKRVKRFLCIDHIDRDLFLNEIIEKSIDTIENHISRRLGKRVNIFSTIKIDIEENCISSIAIDIEVILDRIPSRTISLDVVIDEAIREAFREIETRSRKSSRQPSR